MGEGDRDAVAAVAERPAAGANAPPEADLRALALRLQEIREEERKELAHEIHDVLGQELTMLKLDVVRLLDGRWYDGKRRALGRFVGTAVAVAQVAVLGQWAFAARAAAGHSSSHSVIAYARRSSHSARS